MNAGYLSLMASNILSVKLPAADAKSNQMASKGSYYSFVSLLLSKILSKHQTRVLGRSGELLKKTSALIDDFRNFGRLWRILAIYEAIGNLCKERFHSEMLRGIAWAQTLADLGYQVLENGAYISSKGIPIWDDRQQSRAWIWSSRFLGLVVILDLFKVVWERYTSTLNEAIVEKSPIRRPEVQRREILVNLIYLPLIAHYAVEKGKFSQFWISLFGSAAGGLKFMTVWSG